MPRLITSYKPSRFVASQSINHLLLTPDQRYLVAVATDTYGEYAVESFDAHTGQRLAGITVADSAIMLRLFPDSSTGGFLYIARPDSQQYDKLSVVRITLTNGLPQRVDTPVTFTAPGAERSAAASGEQVYLALEEGVQVRSATDGGLLREIAQPLSGDYNVSGISPDGQLAVFGHWDDYVAQVYRTSDGQLLYELQTRGVGDGDGAHLTFTPDGTQLVTARENVVQFWDAATGAPVRTVECDGIEDDTYIMTLALSADGRYLALAHTGPALSVYDLEANEQLWLDEYLVDLDTCCFGPDSSVLLVTSGRRIMRYDTRTGQPLE